MNNLNLLLVDDEQAFVDAMQKRLSKRKVRAQGVYSGKEALELMAKKNIDVVVLDVKMPGLDGIATLRVIKKEYPLTEVIMLTGHATVESAIEGMKQGAFDYLLKPCEINDLLSKVREAGDKKYGHEQKIIEARAKNIALRRGD